jgi:hypothetical protein
MIPATLEELDLVLCPINGRVDLGKPWFAKDNVIVLGVEISNHELDGVAVGTDLDMLLRKVLGVKDVAIRKLEVLRRRSKLLFELGQMSSKKMRKKEIAGCSTIDEKSRRYALKCALEDEESLGRVLKGAQGEIA